ncbi:hypothetical protein F5148DRAFT_414889 [Russula earlei]|uniref:Uncharacterized protein n=1 Tax=Russula earlei TaxID=71964 RepID=A0ACC0U126_9AGAM|nr:hypothetical protein F5148DRAFT_414889 [Russula earlei]
MPILVVDKWWWTCRSINQHLQVQFSPAEFPFTSYSGVTMRTTYVLVIFCLVIGIAPSLSLPQKKADVIKFSFPRKLTVPSRLGNFGSSPNYEGAPPSSSDSNHVVPNDDSPSTPHIAVKSASFNHQEVVDLMASLRQDDQSVAGRRGRWSKFKL